MTPPILEEVAQAYDTLAQELEKAAEHCRIAANHYRAQEVPRGCAHAWATQGHLHQAQDLLDKLAILHAAKAQTVD